MLRTLFHTVIKPFCISYWQHDLGWKFELRYEHGAPSTTTPSSST